MPSSSTASDSLNQLANKAQHGDAAATRALLSACVPAVHRAVRLVMGPSTVDFDDTVQLALIAFVQSLHTFRGECSPPQFASRIAVRLALANRRKNARRGEHVDWDSLAGSTAANDSPAIELDAERRRQALRQLLDALPNEQAEALACRFALGWSLEEVAQAFDAPVNTIRSRIRLAKEALQRRIDHNPALRDLLEGAI